MFPLALLSAIVSLFLSFVSTLLELKQREEEICFFEGDDLHSFSSALNSGNNKETASFLLTCR